MLSGDPLEVPTWWILCAAVKGLKAFGLTSEEWNKRLARASDAYDKQRKQRHITKKESSKWPKDGFKSLRTAAKDEKLIIKKILKKPEKTLKDLIKIQNWIILFLYRNVFEKHFQISIFLDILTFLKKIFLRWSEQIFFDCTAKPCCKFSAL